MTLQDNIPSINKPENGLYGLAAKAAGWLPRSKQSCGNCSGYFPTGGNQGQCRAVPPTPIFMGFTEEVNVLGVRAERTPIVNGFFPPVAKTIWCRAWSPRVEHQE